MVKKYVILVSFMVCMGINAATAQWLSGFSLPTIHPQAVADSLEVDSVLSDSTSVTPVLPDSSVVTTDSLFSADSLRAVSDTLSLSTDSLRADTLRHTALSDSLGATVLKDSVSANTFEIAAASIDSTKKLLKEVKTMTDMISIKSAIQKSKVKKVYSDTAITNKYHRKLQAMVKEFQLEVDSIKADSVIPNPMYYRLFAPLTLYVTPIHRALSITDSLVYAVPDDTLYSHDDVRLNAAFDEVLMSVYLEHPELVQMTESVLRESKSISESAIKQTNENIKLNVPKSAQVNITKSKVDSPTDVVVKKPNFWVTKGSFSTQFAETYISKNWYKGGANNINIQSTMILDANYNNKKNFNFDNRLEAKLGFNKQEERDLDANQDLLRLTSKIGLRAIRNWNYSAQLVVYTQMLRNYDGNDNLINRFMAPGYGTFSLGMEYRKGLKHGNLSINLGALTYNCRYVDVKELATRYGIKEGRKFHQDFGSRCDINFNYNFGKNVSYRTRLVYYTPFEYVQTDWENTIDFRFSKYIKASLFLHGRFDDSVKQRHEKWGYFQFKQYLMFGLDYSW